MYGTTINGGANDAGTVFQLTPSGILSMLYSFSGGSDGAYPSGDLFADAAGNLYGTTSSGGATASCPGACGTVFELTVPASLTAGGAARNITTKAVRQGVPRIGRR